MAQLPEWVGVALLGAALAVMGYVGKTIIEAWNSIRAERRERRAALVQLRSLLSAARVTFEVQNAHADRLLGSIKAHHSLSDPSGGYEKTFATMYDYFGLEERELHSLIRGMTVHALRPINQAILKWVEEDRFYKAQAMDDNKYGQLARLLPALQAHLVLWHAKYEAWIPDHPEHALVYLADESRHGLGFPSGIDEVVAEVLEREGVSCASSMAVKSAEDP